MDDFLGGFPRSGAVHRIVIRRLFWKFTVVSFTNIILCFLCIGYHIGG